MVSVQNNGSKCVIIIPSNVSSSLVLGGLEIKGFSACVALENTFPGFSKEFLGYDENQDMSVSGKAMAQYGYGSSCSDLPGEIRVNFKHSTTQVKQKSLKQILLNQFGNK